MQAQVIAAVDTGDDVIEPLGAVEHGDAEHGAVGGGAAAGEGARRARDGLGRRGDGVVYRDGVRRPVD